MENRYAVLDIGSNTVRMVIYDLGADGRIVRVIGEKATLGLINFVDDGRMSETGTRKLIETLEGFKAGADKVGCGHRVAFATASLRGISNRQEVLDRVLEETGVVIDVLSGEEEASLNFEGLGESFDLRDGIMIDMGGGSTEVLRFEEGHISELASLDFGCLKMHNQFVSRIMPTQRESERLRTFVRGQVSAQIWIARKTPVAYAIGGTAKAASKVYAAVYKVKRPNTLHLEQLIKLYKYLMAGKERAAMILVEEVPDRLHTLMPGLCGLIEILKIAGAEDVVISTCGLREGYLMRYIERQARSQTATA